MTETGHWQPSPTERRSQPLPAGWRRLRAQVLDRDGHLCQIRTGRCIGRATHVDHAGAPDDHRPEALRAACAPCHQHVTAKQARAAQPSRKRAPERHPGLIDP